MKQLMIHVERIVRPVAAFASRKLRMRRELLAHLQQALEEERAQNGGNESLAVDRALHRLGEPGELTRQLQRSVPLFERLLMSKLPISKRLEQAEQRAARTLYSSTGPLTMGHQSILVLLAAPLAGLPAYTPKIVRDVFTRMGAPAHPAMFFCGLLLSMCLMLPLAYRLVSAAADPRKPLWRAGVIGPMVALMGMQFAYPFFVTLVAANRLPTFTDLTTSVAVTVALLLCSLVLARWVARLRPQYDEWLQLDLA